MNYCTKIHYSLFTTEQDTFTVMAERLLAQLPKEASILRLAFFETPSNNEEYKTRHAVLQEKVETLFGAQQPVLTHVAQAPLNAPLILEVHSFVPDADDTLSYKQQHGHPYVLIENKQGRFLYAGGIQSDIINQTIEQQSVAVFRQVEELMRLEEFPINSIMRQWNYIEQITAFQGEHQNYQSFNNARSDFYANTPWSNGYPAATGIGTNGGGVLIDFDAALFTTADAFATPIDNKLQQPAHAYSDKVLAPAQQKKATPKFERAKSMTFGSSRLVYVSGTAAIRGEESLKNVGLERQLHITMENIAQLTGKAQLSMLRIYLKYQTDYPAAKHYMKAYQPVIPISFICADVCRDELLIEIEGIAIEGSLVTT